MAAHSMSGLKIQNNADINSFGSIHHPKAVVYAELYFLYFIFLTESSSAASCVAPASTSLAVEKKSYQKPEITASVAVKVPCLVTERIFIDPVVPGQ